MLHVYWILGWPEEVILILTQLRNNNTKEKNIISYNYYGIWTQCTCPSDFHQQKLSVHQRLAAKILTVIYLQTPTHHGSECAKIQKTYQYWVQQPNPKIEKHYANLGDVLSTTLTLIYKCSNTEDLKSEPVLLDSSGYIVVKQPKSLWKAYRYDYTKKIRISKE